MNIKKIIKRFIPHFVLDFYYWLWAFFGALIFVFPSRKLVVIGVTGTSGKSTTVDFIGRVLEEAGNKAASISSVKFKIGNKEWKNELKMTMPGRFKIQKFLRQAVRKNCKYVVLEVTSEGIGQFRHKFINFDAAVFTNLSPEHIESHGGFENYRNEKLKLFKTAKNLHIINIDDENAKYFLDIPAKKIITFGIKKGGVNLKNTEFYLNILGNFNQYNALAAVSVGLNYGVSLEICKKALEKVKGIPGRMEIIQKEPFLVVVDYAHTPTQLESVYKTLSSRDSEHRRQNSSLVCVLGSCGGGRDKWKRPVLGKIANQYCREIIITNEDPYDEDPWEIMEQIESGIENKEKERHLVLDRKEAIKKAVNLAGTGDAVVITGKGSEPLMRLEDGKKIPWDDREIVRKILKDYN